MKLRALKFGLIVAALFAGLSHGFLSQSSFVLSGDDEPIRYEHLPSKTPLRSCNSGWIKDRHDWNTLRQAATSFQC